MTTITPEYCFSILLASSAWDELHGLVQVGAFLLRLSMGLKVTHSGRITWWRDGRKCL